MPLQSPQLNQLLRSLATNSASGSGKRLIIGEGMEPMREALKNGGKYLLLHPEAVNKLKQNGIDPFLIYEAGMRMEMEAKISQIDLVGANVDELLQAWSNKPQEQTPIHVQQVIWLNANSNSLGYERSGNSWKLKN
jgi:hypothetical protein